VKRLYRNTSVASPFAIPEDFMLGEDSERIDIYGLKGLPGITLCIRRHNGIIRVKLIE